MCDFKLEWWVCCANGGVALSLWRDGGGDLTIQECFGGLPFYSYSYQVGGFGTAKKCKIEAECSSTSC